MSGLAAAVERKDWELVWLYLLLGVTEAASHLPPESLSELLALVAGDALEPEGGERDGAG